MVAYGTSSLFRVLRAGAPAGRLQTVHGIGATLSLMHGFLDHCSCLIAPDWLRLASHAELAVWASRKSSTLSYQSAGMEPTLHQTLFPSIPNVH